MKRHLILILPCLLALAASGCARFSTTQNDYRYNTDGNAATEDAGDPTGAITGRIYSDVNGNEAWDAGVDTALGGTIVNLLDESGAIVATMTAAADGIRKPAHSRCGLSRGRLRNTRLETYENLSVKLEALDLPGIEHAKDYLFHLYRGNRRPNTIEVNYTSIRLFLEFLKREEITHLEGVTRKHLEAFVEHEQDRGLKPLSVKGRLGSVRAFLRFLTEEGVIRAEVLTRPISVKVPDALPRAIAPEDVKALLSSVTGTRNRVMVLMLLRTGMRNHS